MNCLSPTAARLSAWASGRHGFSCIALSLAAAGLLLGPTGTAGLAGLMLTLGAAMLYRGHARTPFRQAWLVGLMLLGALLWVSHAGPPLPVLEQLGHGCPAEAFNLGINPAKLMLALLLLALLPWHRQCFPPPGQAAMAGKAWAWWLPLAALPLLVAWLAGQPASQPRLAHWWVFAGVNMLGVVLAEELFMRAYLTEWLARVCGRRWLAIALASALFTAMHGAWAAGTLGLLLVGLAAICYAIAYEWRRRWTDALWVHWLVNVGHYGLLQYPLHCG